MMTNSIAQSGEEYPMALTYSDVNKFVREYGSVKVITTGTCVTLSPNGEADSVTLVERDATSFEYEGKLYTRRQFERLVAQALGRGG